MGCACFKQDNTMSCRITTRALRLVGVGRCPPLRRLLLPLSTGLELAYTYIRVVYGAADYVTDYMLFQTNLNLQVLCSV